MKNILNPMKDRKFSNKLELNFNFNRLEYLLKYFNVDFDFVLNRLNKIGLKNEKKNKYKIEDLKKDKLKFSLIKQIDKIFKKGISFYTFRENVKIDNTNSIFFRKKVDEKLNFEDRLVVSKFEEKRLECEILAQNINYDIKRIFKKYDYEKDRVIDVVFEIRNFFKNYEKENLDTKFFQNENKNTEKNEHKYLKALFKIIENNNVFIFENKEYYQKRYNKEKLTFDGFFISPYTIVLKQQKYKRKEIFTLLHEFAHYLINEEEIEEIKEPFQNNKNKIEKWCDEFAFYFLIQDKKEFFENIEENFKENVETLYNKTFLSYSSIYYSLYKNNKINENYLNSKLKEIEVNIINKEKENKKELNRKKEEAKKNNETFFIPSKKEHKSIFYEKLLEINLMENKISNTDYLKSSEVKNE